MIQRQASGYAIGAGNLDFRQFVVCFFKARYLAHQELHFIVVAQFLHLGDGSGCSAESVTTMQEDNRFRLADQVQRPVERRVAATADHEVLAMELARILDPVKQLAVFEFLDAIHLDRARLERADTGSDEYRFGDEARASGGLDIETTIFPAFDHGYFLAEMEGRLEGFNLLEQVVRQFLTCADRHGGNVVDRLVRIQLNALPAHIGQGIDDMGLDFQEAELENLEQAYRTCTDDHCIGFDRSFARARRSIGSKAGWGDAVAGIHTTIQFLFHFNCSKKRIPVSGIADFRDGELVRQVLRSMGLVCLPVRMQPD